MKETLLKTAAAGINILYLPFRLKPQRNKVTIISRQSNKPSMDIKAISGELEGRGIETAVLCKKMDESIKGFVKFLPETLRQMHHIAESKVILLDGYCLLISVLPKLKNKKVVQVWHSLAAIKKFGHQNIGRPGGRDPVLARALKLHRNYDEVLAPGKAMGKLFAEAFNVEEERIRILGLPRIEILSKGEDIDLFKVYEKYPQIEGKKIILYAPTFRRGKGLDLRGIMEAFNLEDKVLVIKRHSEDKGVNSADNPNIIIDSIFPSTTWLNICEKLITDYSAISLEGALLDKELYIYQPDVEEYGEEVGLNIDFREKELKDRKS